MKAFDKIQTQFRAMEIRPLEPSQQQKFAVNWTFLAIIFLITLHIVMVIVFCATEATNYYEYSASVFVTLTALVSIIFYLSFAWQTNSVFKLIDDLDHFANTRKILLPRMVSHSVILFTVFSKANFRLSVVRSARLIFLLTALIQSNSIFHSYNIQL